MTQYTIPDDLPIPEASDIISPLEDDFGDLANAMQVALLRPGAVGSDSERNSTIPNPLPGQRVFRTDLNWTEAYFTAGTVRKAGWFPIDGALPHARFYRSADGSIPSTSTVSFTNATWLMETTSKGLTLGSTSGIVAPVSGLYRVSGTIYWDSNGDGYRAIGFSTTGVGAVSGVFNLTTAPAGAGLYQNFSRELYVEAGATMTLGLSQNSTKSIALKASGTELNISYVGPA